MLKFLYRSQFLVGLLISGMGLTGLGKLALSLPAFAQTSNPNSNNNQTQFPDVPSNYWASPFIQNLTQRGMLAGYLDGTFRPENPIDRDEFAAIIRQAFNQEKVRNIPSQDVSQAFRDVPENYWAEPPIREAYQSGFMGTPAPQQFYPQGEVSKVNALSALARGLDLNYTQLPVASTAVTTPTVAQNPRKARIKPIAFPPATMMMIQPFLSTLAPNRAVAQPPANPGSVTTQTATKPTPALDYLSNYYQDAEQIPGEAANEVAATTQANVVVNYPNVQVLNPNGVLSRGAAAALIYQALVSQGRAEPISANSPAYSYIVNPSNPEAR